MTTLKIPDKLLLFAYKMAHRNTNSRVIFRIISRDANYSVHKPYSMTHKLDVYSYILIFNILILGIFDYLVTFVSNLCRGICMLNNLLDAFMLVHEN